MLDVARYAQSSKMLWISLVFGILVGPRLLDANASKKKGASTPTQVQQSQNYYSTIDVTVTESDLRKADDLRIKTLTSLKELLSKKSSGPKRFELLLRQGELFSERHDYLREIESRNYDLAYKAWEASSKKGKEPKYSDVRSKAELAKAATAFKQLVTEYPSHPRTPAALYSAAKTLGRMGSDSASVYYEQLLKKFPKSPLIPDAHLAMGEYYFEKHEMDRARSAYLQAMKFKEHKAYAYASYKLGWTFFNAASASKAQDVDTNYKKALASFKITVKSSEKNARLGRLNLRQEALNDMVMVWAEMEEVDEAWEYLRSVGEQNSFYALLDKLGNTYADQGKNQKALAMFQRLLKEAPDRPNNPKIYVRVLALQELDNNYENVIATLEIMRQLYNEPSRWVTANAQQRPELVAEAKKLTEFNMHRYGTLFHSRGEKSKSPAMLAAASKIYALYLTTYPKNAQSYEIRYYLADILMEREQFESASSQYVVVSKADPKGKYVKNAALNAVAAINKIDAKTKYDKLPPAGQAPSPLAIPATKKKLIESIENFVQLLPQEKDGFPMRYTVAQIYFDYGHYDEALSRFEKISAEIPSTAQGRAAAQIVLAYHSDKSEWAKVIDLSQKYMAQKNLVTPELRLKIIGMWKNAAFQSAVAQEKQGQLELAAQSYISYQKSFRDDAQADRALYSASANLYKAGKIEDALNVGKDLVEQYPKSKYLPNVYADSAQASEALAQYEQAAEQYRLFASSAPADKRAPASLYNAATLFRGLKKYDRSEKLFAQFMRTYPKNPLAAEAALEVGALQERSGNYSESLKSYQQLSKSEPSNLTERSLLADSKSADLKFRHLDREAGRADFLRLRSRLISKEAPPAVEARQIVAAGLFDVVDRDFGVFKASQLNDPTKVERQVQQKQAALMAAAKGYESVVGVGNPEYTVASLYRLGEMHEDFSTALRSVAPSSSLSQAEQDKFKAQLEKVASPLQEEASKYFQTAFKRSQEGEAFSDWTKKAYQKMAERNPEKTPVVVEQSADPVYMAHKMSKDGTSNQDAGEDR